jgi:hypothetical protein
MNAETQKKTEKRAFDPFAMFRPLQDAWLEGWSKVMSRAVETPELTGAAGVYVDAYLKAIEPMRQQFEKSVERTLHQMQLPTRGEISGIATRLTQIEKKLDDISARLDESK